jgi:hypothetical protein
MRSMKLSRVTIMSVLMALLLGLFAFPTAANAAVRPCGGWGAFDVGPTAAWINMPAYWGSDGRAYNGCYLSTVAKYNGGTLRIQESINYCYGAQLSAAGLSRLSEDGIYGARTKSALIVVQRAIKAQTTPFMSVDGLYGPMTAAWMQFKASNGRCYRAISVN